MSSKENLKKYHLGEIMRKFVDLVKGIPSRVKNQWKSFFNSKHNKITEGAAEEYKSHPNKARGDNWRHPEARAKSTPKDRK